MIDLLEVLLFFFIRNDLKGNVNFVKVLDGRFLHIRYKENEDVIDIINIYAPNKVAERSSFFMLYQKKYQNQMIL